MAWSLNLITAPAAEPVTLAQAKSWCRVDFTDEDTDITDMITDARVAVEEYLSRALITQTWELGLSCFPYCDRILLPRGPVQSITSVKYTDSAEVERTLTAGTDYLVDVNNDLAQIVVPYSKTWPTAVLSPRRPIVIRFSAGYGTTAATVPGPIKRAMRQLIASWYDNRETYTVARTAQAVVALPQAYEALLATYRLRYSGPF